MDAAPNNRERELGGKRVARNPFMDTTEPDSHNMIDLTGDEPMIVDGRTRTSKVFDTNDTRLETRPPVFPTCEAIETVGPELQAIKNYLAAPPTGDDGDTVMAEVKSEPQSERIRPMGSTLATASSHNDDSDDENLFVRQTPERSPTIDGSTHTVVEREEDGKDLAILAAASINPLEHTYHLRHSNARYNNTDGDDDDKTDLYAPPSDHGQSDDEIQEPLGDCTINELLASMEEPIHEAPRSRAKAIRAKNARDWHARENEKGAHAKEKKKALLHRNPTGPNKRFKKPRLTVVDGQGIKPRSDKVALQQAIGNLLYSHPMHARMGRDPSTPNFLESESSVIVTKKAYGEQAIREAECDPETAKKDWQRLERAARQFGSNKCKPTSDHKWKLDSIKLPLYHHQMLGVSWMVAKELDSELHGGINADEMGLGKTVQALGTIVANAPEPQDIKDGKRTTLIVVPSSLVRQWKAEIDLFLETSHRGSVQIFKASDDKSLLDLSFFDIMYVCCVAIVF